MNSRGSRRASWLDEPRFSAVHDLSHRQRYHQSGSRPGSSPGACSAVPSRRPGVSWLGRDQAIRCLTVATVTLSNSASCSRTICRLQDPVTFLQSIKYACVLQNSQTKVSASHCDRQGFRSVSHLLKNSIGGLRQACPEFPRSPSRASGRTEASKGSTQTDNLKGFNKCRGHRAGGCGVTAV